MPTKTDRILGYLPGTFQALPRPTALYALVDAVGTELLHAENSLAELMQAHWVDHADLGAENPGDLVRLAALYGLLPREDESVEEFREHLKRYVRTFLEGTVTVQGILRVTAETLGLHIADDHQDLDAWWARPSPALVTVAPRGEDAARLVLGVPAARVEGVAARAAAVVGTVNLSPGVDLRPAAVLRLAVNGGAAAEVDLLAGVADPARVTPNELLTALGAAAVAGLEDGRYLRLASPTVGPDGRLAVLDGPDDAAERILSLPPRTYRGSDAAPASISSPDLSAGADLNEDARYLRVAIDGTLIREVDLGTGQRSLDQLRDTINAAFGVPVAAHDGHRLTLTSPTSRAASSVELQAPAGQDAAGLLFPGVDRLRLGRDAQPARLTGRRDLVGGVDLQERSMVALRVDGTSLEVDLAGADPAATQRPEIVTAINAAFGQTVASLDGVSVTVASPTVGAAAEVALETAPNRDAGELVFGIGPREFAGAPAAAARLAGAEVAGPLNLVTRHALGLSVDGGPSLEVDLRSAATDQRAVTLPQLAAAVNAVAGAPVAAVDGQCLTLASSVVGAGSMVEVHPLARVTRRQFVTRAVVTDEAAQALFGFVAREAAGAPATPARVKGTIDLTRGVDLSSASYLRVSVDGGLARDVLVAGPRPRTTLLGDVVGALNAVFHGLASGDGRHLLLTSPSAGGGSAVTLEAPRPCLDLLGLEPGLLRGVDAAGVAVVGTVDLHDGVDLPAGAALRIGVDDRPPVEVALAPDGITHQTLGDVANRINVALASAVAAHDGIFLRLASPSLGSGSRVVLEVPDGTDVTGALLGFAAPRAYHGSDASRARVVGAADLAGGADMRRARRLVITVDGGSMEVDCAAGATDPTRVTLPEIVAAVNAVVPGVASHDGHHLILTSAAAGSAGRIQLQPSPADDARTAVLGDRPEVDPGRDPTPATIQGEADLTAPVDLSQRSVIRLSRDGGYPVDIDVRGAAPSAIFLDEVVAAINQVLPGLARAGEDGTLQLSSASAGEGSRLALLPLRHLEVEEFPILHDPASVGPLPVRHGDGWPVVNQSAAQEAAEILVAAARGVVGPALVDETLGWEVRVLGTVDAGATLRLAPDAAGGVRAEIRRADGTTRPVPPDRVLAAPLGERAGIPFAETRHPAPDREREVSLLLDDPGAPDLVRLRPCGPGAALAVAVTEADLAGLPAPRVGQEGATIRIVGRIRERAGEHVLEDAGAEVLARLRSGPGGDPGAYRDRVVAVGGRVLGGTPTVLTVQSVAPLFDVGLTAPDAVGERYRGVTIGRGTGRDSLVWQLSAGAPPSTLALAEELRKDTVLTLPKGRSRWRYLDCHAARYDEARFDRDRFSGGRCDERGVFDVSRFAGVPGEPVEAVFASAAGPAEPVALVSFCWPVHSPGAFQVHLPADLPARFGARFDQARFARPGSAPEVFRAAVTEPPGDERFIVTLVNQGHPAIGTAAAVPPSTLVAASLVQPVPLGWSPVPLPFRRPQRLSLGGPDAKAAIHLAEEGFAGRFLKLEAKEEGAYGNAIAVAVRSAGPGQFDMTIQLEAARFEHARQAVLGQPPQLQGEHLVQPGPVGVLQAKAAGVHVEALRGEPGGDGPACTVEGGRNAS